MFVKTIPAGQLNSPGEYGRDLMNAIGEIIEELFTNGATGGYIVPIEIEMPEPWGRTGDDNSPAEGDAVVCVLRLGWGVLE